MDDKGSRQTGRWRQGNTKKVSQKRSMKRAIPKSIEFLRVHKQALLTVALLSIMVVLLFAVFGQFQPPVVSSAPSGVTEIDYSTFVAQVKAENVEGVTIQGSAINA